MLFDLKHAFYAMAGAAIGAIAGYLFGLVLYVVTICSSAFTTDTNIATLVTSAGVYPLMFSILIAAIGFFAGWYISHDKDQTSQPSTVMYDIGPNLAQAMPALLAKIEAQGKKNQPDGPPEPTT